MNENRTDEERLKIEAEEKAKKEKEKEEKEKEAEKRRRRIIELLILIILLLLLLRSCGPWGRISPDYPPQGTEDQQEPIDDDDSDKMDSEEGGGAINVTYSMDVTVDLSDKTVSLYYANPNASNQNVSILLMVDDLVVAKSDLITPGHQVRQLPLESYAKSKLMAGGYDASLVVRSYNPENGEKAMINTEGKVDLTVVD